MNKQNFRHDLLQWYDQQKRILPWRDNPDPYHVWISEIMLQQTRVETVIPYFERFIKTFPTIRDVAQAEDDLLNKMWEGLGYYSRVRNIKKAAIQMLEKHNAMVPSDQKALLSLPGIGPYTAGAVRSIAFDIPDTAVDGNVLRVFARITAEQNNIKDKQVKQSIKEFVTELIPTKRVGDFNQALMELGATICLPNGTPLCAICPVNEFCEAYDKGLTTTIPIKQKKKARRTEKRTVLLLRHNNHYAIEKRPDTGLLAGLYQFPNLEGHLTLKEIKEQFINVTTIQKLPKSKHIFSHLEWHMIGYVVDLLEPINEYIYVRQEEITNVYSIPTAFKVYRNWIQSDKS